MMRISCLLSVRASFSCAVVASLLVSGVALADTSPAIDRDGTGLTIDGMTLEATNVDRSTRTYTANIRDCRRMLADNPRLEFRWQLRNSPLAGSEYAIKYRRGSQVCELNNVTDDADSECEVPVASESLDGSTVSWTIRARDLLDVDGPEACTADARTADVYFVFSRQTGSTTAEAFDSDRIRLRLATSRPDPPQAVDVRPGENSLRIEWEEPSNADGLEGYVIYWDTSPFDISGEPEELEGTRRRTVGTVTSATVTEGVSLGNTYWVAVTSRSRNLNESFFSSQVEATTVPVQDFWQLYRESGGVEEGGYCSVAPAATWIPAWLLLLVGLVLARRRTEVA
ncbi:MAG: fibronectin type III domain-containing protein [Deltaproteobacteria bacterium]|nr:MAG: fibronectin type III domain-containing protein [Deltaproteobacteria bacterium]